MKYSMSMLAAVEETLYLLSRGVKQALADWCDIESLYHDIHTFSTTNGGLLSLWRNHGVLRLVGEREYAQLMEQSRLALQTPLQHRWHSFQAVFSRDPERTAADLTERLAPLVNQLPRLHLDLADLVAARSRALERVCVFEEAYFAAWTHPTLFSRPERRKADQARLERRRGRPPAVEAQNPDRVYADLLEAHQALCKVLGNEFANAGLFVEPLEGHDALRAIRRAIEPARTAPDWWASLPGDPLPLRIPARATRDVSDLFWPPIGQQLFPSDGERGEDTAIVRVGERLYSSVYLETPPQYVQPFAALFTRLDVDLPWRIAFRLDGDGLAWLGFKRFMAAVLVFTNPANRLIVDAVNGLEQQVREGEATGKLRIAASTWAPAGKPELVRMRRQRLAKAIESWGICQARLETGDAAQGMAATLPALYNGAIGAAAAAPVNDVVQLLPLTRPASPWTAGAVQFRAPDGKIWPFQPGSAVQPGWVEVYVGPPGYGKSVLLHLVNLAFVLASEGLPWLGGIDIGASSEGLVDLIREALPPAERHLALYRRLRQTPADAINHFDTQLGCRMPLPHERAALANFLTLLGTPIGRAKADEGVAELAVMVIDETYKSLRDDEHGHPKRYAATVDALVDEALERHGLKFPPDASWWAVVDRWFEDGFIALAIRAQRYAVPTLEDAVHVLTSAEAIKEIWGDKLAGGEPIIKALSRQWRSSARQFPLVARPTALDLANARILFLDLEEVASRGGEVSERETAVMYMLARHIVATPLFLHPEHLRDIPPAYQDYHEARIRAIREAPKRLCYDEYHRIRRGGEATHEQVQTDAREGRKRDVQLAVSSQYTGDFDQALLEMSTSRFILGLATEASVKEAVATFGFTEGEQAVIRTRLHAPTADGAPFLFQFETKRGQFSQHLLATASAEELWALSTVNEDAAIRRRVRAKLDARDARRALAQRFPSGSAKEELERLRLELQRRGQFSTEQEARLLDQLAEEVLAMSRLSA